MIKPSVIITVGLPASGKSTWAKSALAREPGVWKRVNKDDLRAMIDDGKWSPRNEKFVVATRNRIILQALHDGFGVIVDDTNLDPKHEEDIRRLVGSSANVLIKFFDTTPEVCIARDALRTGSAHVGEEVIRKMIPRWEVYNASRSTLRGDLVVFQPYAENLMDIMKPSIYLCDIDGTLALFDRSPYDTKSAGNDRVNIEVAATVEAVVASGYQVFFLSGRSDEFRELTQAWLGRKIAASVLPMTKLLMRRQGDTRDDSIVKYEIFNEHIRGKYNVLGVFDDRPRVIRMWKELGLMVFDCGEGFEF